MVAGEEPRLIRAERRARARRSVLLPVRVSVDGRVMFEGATRNVSPGGLYFRMPGHDAPSAGERVRVEISVPAEMMPLLRPGLATGGLGYREFRDAVVVRVEKGAIGSQTVIRPRACGVALALDADAVAPAARRRETATSEVA